MLSDSMAENFAPAEPTEPVSRIRIERIDVNVE